MLEQCVNCGLRGGKKQIKPKIVHSQCTDNYYEILVCLHCDKIDDIVVQYGDKQQITKRQAMELLTEYTRGMLL